MRIFVAMALLCLQPWEICIASPDRWLSGPEIGIPRSFGQRDAALEQKLTESAIDLRQRWRESAETLREFGEPPSQQEILNLFRASARLKSSQGIRTLPRNQGAQSTFRELQSANELTKGASEDRFNNLLRSLKELCPNCDVTAPGSGNPCPVGPQPEPKP